MDVFICIIHRDASKVPGNAGNFDSVDLYNTGSDGKDILVVTLSKNFDSHAGAVGFTVPSSVIPGSYFVKGVYLPVSLTGLRC